jgi:hypothetical protein
VVQTAGEADGTNAAGRQCPRERGLGLRQGTVRATGERVDRCERRWGWSGSLRSTQWRTKSQECCDSHGAE